MGNSPDILYCAITIIISKNHTLTNFVQVRKRTTFIWPTNMITGQPYSWCKTGGLAPVAYLGLCKGGPTVDRRRHAGRGAVGTEGVGPLWKGSGDGTQPLPRKFFNFLNENGMFWCIDAINIHDREKYLKIVKLQLCHNCSQQTETQKSSYYQMMSDGDVSDFVALLSVWALGLSPSVDKLDLDPFSLANGDLVSSSVALVPETSLVEDCFWISWNSSNNCPTWSSRSSFSRCSVSFSPSAWWVAYLPSCCASVTA